jgi:phosphoribosylglycinamide formyltransferase 1
MRPQIVVCASGEGTNFEALVYASRNGELNADIAGLIVNRAGCGALERAKKLGIPARVLSLKSFPERPQWDQAMADQMSEWKADWVVLAGYLALIGPTVLSRYPARIVNSHPALLPRHGGPGMYGRAVHQAVLTAGDTETGVTVHLIDEHFDRGRIIKQERIPVLPGDSVESLEARVKSVEVRLYPKVLNDLVTKQST